MKYAELPLPYFKQGDDLAANLEGATNEEALEAHAAQLEAAAAILRAVKAGIAGRPDVKFDADTHHIGVTGPDDVIDALLAAGHLQPDPFEEGEAEDFEDCEDDEDAEPGSF